MTQDKNQHSVTSASAILLVFVVSLTFFAVSIVRAAPGPDSAGSAATFRTKCAMCHGPEGERLRGRKEHERSGPSLTRCPRSCLMHNSLKSFPTARGGCLPSRVRLARIRFIRS